MKTNMTIHFVPLLCLIYGIIAQNSVVIVISGSWIFGWYLISCLVLLYFMEEMYDRYCESSPPSVKRRPVQRSSTLELQF